MELPKVIVDVPVKQTDRPFDYLVPDSMKDWIEVGSRVGVPFGHRTVQGFVVDLVPRTGEESFKLKADSGAAGHCATAIKGSGGAGRMDERAICEQSDFVL